MALTISPGTPQDTAQVAPPLRKLAGIISPAPAAVSERKRLLKWDPLIRKARDLEPDGPIARNMGHGGWPGSTGKCMWSLFSPRRIVLLQEIIILMLLLFDTADHIIPGQVFGRVEGPIVFEKILELEFTLKFDGNPSTQGLPLPLPL